MKMRILIVIAALLCLFENQVEVAYTASINGNADVVHRSNARAVSRYHSRPNSQYARIKSDSFLNDFADDDDIFDLTKRQQQPPSDDYGHLRFGKRDEQFDDYGHMRFGRNGGDK